MESIVGVFRSRSAAESAARDLQRLGYNEESLIFLTPEATPEELAKLPTTASEERGIGKAISSVVGAAIGGGAGLGLGSAAASLFVPGIGPILAIGIGAGALLGAGGAIAGAKAGSESEATLDNGVAIDEVPRLRELLKMGHSVVAVSVTSKEQAEQVRALFNTYGGDRFAQRGLDEDKAA